MTVVFLQWCILRGVLLITAVKSFIFQATIVTFADDPKSLFDNGNEAFVSIFKLKRRKVKIDILSLEMVE
jgi:hypothetical protein